MSFNPLEQLTNDELWNIQLLLELNCGRSKSVLRKNRREIICSFTDILKQEADHRSQLSPTAPYHPGDLRA
jgi:hypothetical protein